MKITSHSRGGDLPDLRCKKVIPLGLALTLALFFSQCPIEAAPYIWATLAGSAGYGSVNGTGASASFYSPKGLAADISNNVYVADTANHLIRKVTAAGVVTTFAGMAGVPGGADGSGASAQFNFPAAVALDTLGNLFVADGGNCTIRKITAGGTVTTFAGMTAVSGSADGTGTNASFSYPQALAIDGSNNIYVADTQNCTIRMITPAGKVTTLAGTANVTGSSNGLGSAAQFLFPNGIAVDEARNVYVSDTFNNTIRLITAAGLVTTFAGTPGMSGNTEGTNGTALFAQPFGIAYDGMGNLYVADNENSSIRKIVILTGVASDFAGPGQGGSPGSADGAGINARFRVPQGIAVSASGSIFVSDTGNNEIRAITISNGVGNVTSLAGIVSAGSTDGPANLARFNEPGGIAVDASNNVYVSDTINSTIRVISSNGVVSTLAGTAGQFGHADGTNGTASFIFPGGIALDHSNNLFVADSGNNTIRMVTPAGVVTTFAGTAGVRGSSNAIGTAASFAGPQGVAVDASNNVYVADTGNNMIRMITPEGVVTTIAGSGIAGNSNGPASQAQFRGPAGIAVDASNNVFVADTGNNLIRKITPVTAQIRKLDDGTVTTLAGNGQSGDACGPYDDAEFYYPWEIACCGCKLFVADSSNFEIRELDRGLVVTIGGKGEVQGDTDGISWKSRFYLPLAIVNRNFELFVADQANNTIRVGMEVPHITAWSAVPGQVILSWPGAVEGFVFQLQSSSTIGDSASWTDVPILPMQMDRRMMITVPNTEESGYYRLNISLSAPYNF